MVLSSQQATSRVHPVHMMNVEWCQAAADPQTRPNYRGCESACRLPVGCQKPHPPLPFISDVTIYKFWFSINFEPTIAILIRFDSILLRVCKLNRHGITKPAGQAIPPAAPVRAVCRHAWAGHDWWEKSSLWLSEISISIPFDCELKSWFRFRFR